MLWPAMQPGPPGAATRSQRLVQELVHLVAISAVAAVNRGGADPLVLEGDLAGVGLDGVLHADVKVIEERSVGQ